MEKKSLVSVIVPVYNGERYLGDALESIFAQDYRLLETIVVDDGSIDKSAHIARSFPEVLYIYKANQGVAAARNSGIAAARGEFIAFLDQDDIWMTNKLSVQINHLLEHHQIGYVISHQQLFLEPGTNVPLWLKKDLLFKDHPGYIPSALVVRRTVFEQIGVFDTAYTMGSDGDWFARAKDAGILMAVLPETLLRRRIHSSNCSSQAQLGMRELLKVVKTSIDRQQSNKPEKG